MFYLARGNRPEHTLRYSPILFHDLSYLPHPYLARHIVAAAKNTPELAERVITAASIAPGQRQAAKRALAELQAMELAELARSGKFALAPELQSRPAKRQKRQKDTHFVFFVLLPFENKVGVFLYVDFPENRRLGGRCREPGIRSPKRGKSPKRRLRGEPLQSMERSGSAAFFRASGFIAPLRDRAG